MRFFLNPIQFYSASSAAGIDQLSSRRLYAETVLALAATTAAQIREQGVSKPLTPRTIPATARSPLREALERQNAERAAAVEVQVLPAVAVTFCANIVADVRVVSLVPTTV
jgi:hypothetical protein